MSFDAKKPRILVALGGRSSERKVSILSGKAVALALEKKGYPTDILDVGTGKFHQIPELDALEKDASKIDIVPSFPLADIKRHFSLVFIAMHGRFGEDGGLQALLDEIEVKYVGSGPASCALAMDKRFSKIVMSSAGIPTSEFQVIYSIEDKLNIKFPVVVKPIKEGSSIGVFICENEADYKFAVKSVIEKYYSALVEPYLGNQEFTVGVLEGEKGQAKALPVIEIKPKKKFFDFDAKYDGTTEEIVPAQIEKKLTEELQDIAIKTHNAFAMRHMSRVDIMVQNGKPQVLELNPIPGLTSESLLPKAAHTAGFEFEDLIEHLVKIALK
jgi:D-alanine-D-alanine ligase